MSRSITNYDRYISYSRVSDEIMPINHKKTLERELITYIKHWGIIDADKLSPLQLLKSYLATSAAMCSWVPVYEHLGLPVDLDQLRFGTKKVDQATTVNISDTFYKRQRSPDVYAAIFCTCNPREPELQENASFTAFVDQCITPLGDHIAQQITQQQQVMLFHLLGETISGGLSSLLQEDALGLVNALGKRHVETLCSNMRRYRSGKTHPKDVAQLIDACEYPCLNGITMRSLIRDVSLTTRKPQQVTTKRRPAGSSIVTRQRNAMTTTTTANGKSTAMYSCLVPETFAFPKHHRVEWNIDTERRVGDDQRFVRYKEFKQHPIFYPNKETLIEYLVDALCREIYRKDFDGMKREELQEFIGIFVDHVDPSVVTETAEGKRFVKAMTETIAAEQVKKYTTKDVITHMIMAYHPQWKAFYSHYWNYPRQVIDQVAKYTKAYPTLSQETINAFF